MRQIRTVGGGIVLAGCAILLAGCAGGAWDGLCPTNPGATTARPRSRPAVRVARPRPIEAGQRVRRFCGERHVQFQAGRLAESPEEMARNNALCRQAYAT